MVKVKILIVPLHTQVVLPRVLKGGVDGGQVLAAAHGGNPSVCGVISWSVLEGEPDWQPSLLDFWIWVIGSIVIRIDQSQQFNCYLVDVCLQSVVEDNFQVTIKGSVVQIIGRGTGTLESDEVQSELHSFIRLRG